MNFIAWGVSEGLCARGCETLGQLWYLWAQSEEICRLSLLCLCCGSGDGLQGPAQTGGTHKKSFFPQIFAAIYSQLSLKERFAVRCLALSGLRSSSLGGRR